MINKDKTLIRLRRKVSILLVSVLFLLYLLKIKFDSEKFILEENQIIFLENLEKDKEISDLNHKIDSLKKLSGPILEKIDTKKKINTKKEETKKIPTLITDTILPTIEDGQKTTPPDTL